MKKILESIIVWFVATIVLKALEKYIGVNIMESIFQTFIIELWPIWVGLLIACIYWLVRDYIKLRNSSKKLMAFKQELREWIGLFEYEDKIDRRKGYSSLAGKINHYLREELELQSLARIKYGEKQDSK